MELFDVHCHLQAYCLWFAAQQKQLAVSVAMVTRCDVQDPRISSNLEQTLQLAAESGVKYFGCNGTCEQDWPEVCCLLVC